jgi:hypothetical protein
LPIAVIYCGGCNPEIEREALVKRLGQKSGYQLFHMGSQSVKPDLVLAVNGCARECMDSRSIGSRGGKIIVVAGCRIDGWPVAREEMVDALMRKINEIELQNE